MLETSRRHAPDHVPSHWPTRPLQWVLMGDLSGLNWNKMGAPNFRRTHQLVPVGCARTNCNGNGRLLASTGNTVEHPDATGSARQRKRNPISEQQRDTSGTANANFENVAKNHLLTEEDRSTLRDKWETIARASLPTPENDSLQTWLHFQHLQASRQTPTRGQGGGMLAFETT